MNNGGSAIISYSVDEGGEIVIDVGLEDYSEATIDKFSLLFASIPSNVFQVQSMEILRLAFENDGKEKEFEEFIRGVFIKSAMLESPEGQEEGLFKRKSSNDPIIKPTDLL